MRYAIRDLTAYFVTVYLVISGHRISKYHRHNETFLYRWVNVVKANLLAESIRKSDLA